MDTTERLARAFSAVLAAWLTPEELAEAVRLNAAQTDPNVCHSHDHCDANMAMCEAWGQVFGTQDIDLDDEAQTAQWGSAWGMAKAAAFYTTARFRSNDKD